MSTSINLPRINLTHVKKESDMSRRKRKNKYELTEWDKKRGLVQIPLFDIDEYKAPVGWVTDENNVIKVEGK